MYKHNSCERPSTHLHTRKLHRAVQVWRETSRLRDCLELQMIFLDPFRYYGALVQTTDLTFLYPQKSPLMLLIGASTSSIAMKVLSSLPEGSRSWISKQKLCSF
ncbi:hypothetical protein BT69DRAFT_715745 [Atractiella rhizophila]|nr:hypothetical protein BT69DRAFT_715745 [Atractiella rhizophila]